MVDLALSLADGRRSLTAVSRRAQLPRAHADASVDAIAAPAAAAPGVLLREVRRASRGADWRNVIDGFRPSAQAIWATWSPAQRQSFLRHARCWWDAHRHRTAPTAARRIAELQGQGVLTVRAARTLSLSSRRDGIEAAWTARSGAEVVRERYDAVINCMGRSADVRRSHDRMLRQLLAAGLVRPDPTGFGLEVDSGSRPIDAAGAPTPGLYAAGPLTQGRFWEITAIPDIRVQVSRLARTIMDPAQAH